MVPQQLQYVSLCYIYGCFLMINEAVLKQSITLLPFPLISQWQLKQCINHCCWIWMRLSELKNIFTDGIHSKSLEIIKDFLNRILVLVFMI